MADVRTASAAVDAVAEALDRIDGSRHPNVWISRVALADALAAAGAVDPTAPLAGAALAVKDNIDVAGLATTAGCPAYAYEPSMTAPVVGRLVAAGAVVVGKTNLDQFATGLVGTRTPYGPCRSALDPRLISGGSSSGSAVAVAAGLARFGLGTDTAGSGRVPAACNGIVGFKPSVGLLPTTGIVPACRTLDCPSVFTTTVADARLALDVLAPKAPRHACPGRLRVGVPRAADLEPLAGAALDAFAATVATLDSEVVEVDLTPFLAAGHLLYGGSWVAERYAAVGAFVDAHPGDVDPVVGPIISRGAHLTAVQAFEDRYRLDALGAETAQVLAGLDVLLLPTVPDVPTIDEVLADPVATNVRLGTYTTFVNLLRLCAVAVPGAPRADGVPHGVTVVAPGGADHLALDVAASVVGELIPPRPFNGPAGRIDLAVAGAHLGGQPLNHQLTERGAHLVRSTTTASAYRLHALSTTPPKPGLERVGDRRGAAIDVEVWSLPAVGFADFVACLPRPMVIGKVELADGTLVPGFLCEPEALAGARDITEFGGWRSFLGAST